MIYALKGVERYGALRGAEEGGQEVRRQRRTAARSDEAGFLRAADARRFDPFQ